MLDYYRTAITKLLSCNYDVFVPLQQLGRVDEIVVSNGNWVRRAVIRSTRPTDKGPIVEINLPEFSLVDYVIASFPLLDTCWLLKLSDMVAEHGAVSRTVRLGMSHDDDVIRLIHRFDSATERFVSATASALMEQTIIDEALKEQEFYNGAIQP